MQLIYWITKKIDVTFLFVYVATCTSTFPISGVVNYWKYYLKPRFFVQSEFFPLFENIWTKFLNELFLYSHDMIQIWYLMHCIISSNNSSIFTNLKSTIVYYTSFSKLWTRSSCIATRLISRRKSWTLTSCKPSLNQSLAGKSLMDSSTSESASSSTTGTDL